MPATEHSPEPSEFPGPPEFQQRIAAEHRPGDRPDAIPDAIPGGIDGGVTTMAVLAGEALERDAPGVSPAFESVSSAAQASSASLQRHPER
jgi:hypothetical protein